MKIRGTHIDGVLSMRDAKKLAGEIGVTVQLAPKTGEVRFYFPGRDQPATVNNRNKDAPPIVRQLLCRRLKELAT